MLCGGRPEVLQKTTAKGYDNHNTCICRSHLPKFLRGAERVMDPW
uniref:Uncharacterized protein n=1 Tax=Physcomitrium patens TaxID=3218 RepID=A0A2K1L071_PHYPA|nr:hypothetical protein PHYPA_002214 [Physcomitrium patens]